MRTLNIFILFIILLMAAGTTIAAEEKWRFIEKDQGVTIHSRRVDGHAESEFRGTEIINQPVEVIGAVLADIPSYTRWFFKCIRARKIPDRTSTNLNFQLHIVIETPWPLWNRDAVYAARTRIDVLSGKITVQGTALPNTPVPVSEHHIRVTDSALQWVLERLDDNRTMVSFTERINAGGNLGSYLSDAGCRKTVFESLLNLSRIASDPQYAALGKALREAYGQSNRTAF